MKRYRRLQQEFAAQNQKYLELSAEKSELEYQLSERLAKINQIQKQEAEIRSLHQNVRQLKHDMKNYMLGIASLLENGETEKAKAVINSSISELLDNEKSFDATGNALIDTVIAVKIKEASDFGIKTETKLEIDSEINIEPVDFSML
ncbi:MAG: hypothetical protein ACI4QX_07325, partial [Lachnospiraceae bacterium]